MVHSIPKIPEWMQDIDTPMEEAEQAPTKVRTIWISDVHLGSKGSKADELAEFLKNYNCDTLFLVGDIIDGWRMRKKVFWPQAHTNVIRRILTRAKRGTRVVYITGNHDDIMRRYSGIEFGNILLTDEYIYTLKNGDKVWVIHGDQFDGVVQCHRWLAFLGDWAYETVLNMNRWFNAARRRLGFGYWSLSAYLKYKVKRAVNFISDFEQAVAKSASNKQVKGVICGHIHHPEIRQFDYGVTYYNCGDWVESLSALIEDEHGEMHLIHWSTKNQDLEGNNPS
ncbi:UDP-2,3-diacylglucosamine diphosphatase [Thiomicrospira microaerophila]|uniref:UDP-2,3-diacylglucosamine diphosphatase n=1 Tax=Thiomicrospira microaerophila TaxID=406020 RepID=UPI00200DFEF1|nr:UDP-2,3-diacylglucosamine diphosphatase [Thiomicrospira microaerophila]UQB43135.1 UDP-2,3-diacylglucosamine diphosphatase [Thiomicrospira microaerophila]